MSYKSLISTRIAEMQRACFQLVSLAQTIDDVSQIMIQALRNGRKIMFAGNGGSAADAQHLAAEIVGRFKINRDALPAIALTTDTSILTSIGNDFGFDKIFSRQVEALGQGGDVLVLLSTSGKSKNLIEAAKVANENSITIIALIGGNGAEFFCDRAIPVPATSTPLIQQLHIVVGHILCELIEEEFA